MNIWSTFRYVPPISPEAMAWATLSFATYLAASEMQPQVGGHDVAPLALAMAVQLALSITKNLTSDKYARSYARAPKAGIIMPMLIFCGLAALAVFASSVVAAKLMVLYFLAHAAILSWGATYAPQHLKNMQGTWTGTKTHRRHAVMLEAAGLVISAATLVTTWVFAGPLAFAAMMSFGVLVVRTVANWIIVMYLLDAMDRDETDGEQR